MTPDDLDKLIAENLEAVAALKRLYGFSDPEAMAFLAMGEESPQTEEVK